jgi:hypothetical protein
MEGVNAIFFININIINDTNINFTTTRLVFTYDIFTAGLNKTCGENDFHCQFIIQIGGENRVTHYRWFMVRTSGDSALSPLVRITNWQ